MASRPRTGLEGQPGLDAVEIIPFALPFSRPYVTATGQLEQRSSVLLRLTARDGAVGLGEGVPLALRGGADTATVVAELDAWRLGAAIADASPPARCAVATALADLEAKRQGLPLWRWLDPDATPAGIHCNATITAGTVADAITQCENWAADGFTVFKLKAGPEEAVALAAAVRRSLGDRARIRIDANGTWKGDAPRLLDELEPIGIELVEEPVSGLAELASLAAGSPIPLVADESVNNAGEAAEAARTGACAAATVKLSKIGGLDATLDGSLPTYLSSALDGPVGIAAAAHVAQTLDRDRPWPQTAHGLATSRLFAAWPARSGPGLRGNRLELAAGPGLGVELDETLLDRLRLDR